MNQYLAICQIRDMLSETMEQSSDPAITRQLHAIDAKLQYFLEKDVDFKKVVDCLDDGVFITDNQGNVLYVNPAYTKNTGIQPERVINHNVREDRKSVV